MLTYGINTKGSIGKYDSMSEGHKFRFVWLSEKYPDQQDLMYVLLGCIFSDVNVQFDTKESIVDSYFKFKARRESLTYVLKSAINKYNDLEDKHIDKVIFKYFTNEYPPEFLLLLVHDSTELTRLYNSPDFSWGRDKILKLIKYQSFFNSAKYLPLLSTQ